VAKIRFPYVPGLLSFREVPLLLKAIAKLQRKPDLIIVDGQGIAHPRRIGLASHLGLALDTPTIGSAKSLLIGDYEMPGESRGSAAPLMAGRERIGTVLRTRDGVRPMFISTGHRVSLRSAVKFVLRCGDGFRLPKPQREADLWTKQLRCGK
jgi:deoxyribonuclease V